MSCHLHGLRVSEGAKAYLAVSLIAESPVSGYDVRLGHYQSDDQQRKDNDSFTQLNSASMFAIPKTLFQLVIAQDLLTPAYGKLR